MSRFSDRLGLTERPALARDEISPEFLTALWNLFHPILEQEADGRSLRWQRKFTAIYEYLHWRLNTMSYHVVDEVAKLEQWFFLPRPWYEVYNFVEHVARVMAAESNNSAGYFAAFNEVFEREGSPCRFVGETLSLITDPIEIAAVEEALSVKDKFSGARKHLSDALVLLDQRPEPNYRNSIKESISSVESVLKVLTAKTHGDLAASLREFKAKNEIHGALFKGLDNLYGYTSNEHGLRHALIEADAKVGYAEAKFMLVACAAFVSFLITKASE